jgi:uncharacterized membrane protein YkvA (DUF1232 family)
VPGVSTLIAVAVSVAAALVVGWLALAFLLGRGARGQVGLGDVVRLLPDLLRLVSRLARDRSLPRGIRLRLWLLLGYLATPIDVIPDFIPVIGYADDIIVVALVLRSVVRRAGPEAIGRHWPGTADGLAVVLRVTSYDGRLRRFGDDEVDRA